MSNKKVDISCNSQISLEKNLSDVLAVECWSRDKENKALELDDILNAERPVQIQCDKSAFCTVNLQAAPHNEFALLTVVTQCPKVEVFYNKQQEYRNTHYGVIFDDFEDVKVYTFDIAIEKPSITDVTFKFLPEASEFWIYCIIVYLYPNTSALLPSRFNLENVQNILTDSSFKLSPSAEKCKDFMKSYLKPNTNASHPQMLLSMLNSNFEQKLRISNSSISDSTSIPKITSAEIAEIKEYFDIKILDLENRLLQRIEETHQQQNKKLDEILNFLRNKT